MKPPIEVNNVRSQLSYLTDTKEIIKQALLNKGANITDETTFRNYATEIDKLGNVKIYNTLLDMEADTLNEDGTVSVVYDNNNFNGLFVFNGTNNLWEPAKTQFTAEDADVMAVSYFGANGVSTGDLNSPKYFTDSNISNITTYFNAYANLYDSLDTSNISDFENFGPKYIPNDMVAVNFIDVSNKASRMTNMFANMHNMFILQRAENWDVSGVYYMTNMFRNCSNLRTLNVTGWVPNNVRSTAYMFDLCVNLENIAGMVNMDFSKATEMIGMFNRCSALNGGFANWNCCNVTSMHGMFQNCNNLYTVFMTNWNVENVKTLSNMFYDCNNFYWINRMPQFSNVTSAVNMFYHCHKLGGILTANDEIFGNCTTMVNMFAYCDEMTYISNNGINLHNTKNTSRMFFNCCNLDRVNLGGDANSLTNMYQMFTGSGNGCAIYNIPNVLLNTPNLEVAISAYQNCWNLQYANINWNMPNLRSIDKMFANCNRLARLYMNNANLPNLISCEGFINSCKAMSALYLNNAYAPRLNNLMINYLSNISHINIAGADLINVNHLMFNYCSNLKTFNAYNAKTTYLADLSYFIYGAYALNNLNVSKLDTANVTNMAWAFYSLKNIENINLSTWNTNSLVNAYQLFSGCSNLKTLDLTGWDVSNVENMYAMFSGCSNLMDIDVSNWNVAKVNAPTSLFNGCTSFVNMNISGWNLDSTTVVPTLFGNCTNLTTLDASNLRAPNATTVRPVVTLSNQLTSLNIENWYIPNATTLSFNNMITNCPLTELNLTSWNICNVRDASNLFEGCDGLETLNCANWDTTNITLLNNAFYKCLNLTNIDLTGWNLENVTSLYKTFSYSNVNLLPFADFQFSNVTTLTGAFSNSFYIGVLPRLNWNTANVKTMFGAFENTGFTDIDLRHWNLDNVTSTYYMFRNSYNLVNVNLNISKMPNLNNVYSMYANCRSLSNMQLIDWNAFNITSLSEFASGTGITSLDMLNCTFDKLTSGYSSFVNCKNLKAVNIENCTFNSMNNLSYMFRNSNNIETIKLINLNLPVCTTIYGMFSPQLANSTTVDVSYLNAPVLQNAELFPFIGVTNNYGFEVYNLTNCRFDTLASVYGLFPRFNNIKAIDCSNLYVPNASNFIGMFWGDLNLENLNVDNLYAPNVTNCFAMFGNCKSLSDDSLANLVNMFANMPNIENVGDLFDNCKFSGANKANYIVNMCLNFTNATVKIFNNKTSQSPIHNCYINVYNIGGTDRSQELIDAGWTL